MMKRTEAPTPEFISAGLALFDTFPLKTPNDKELFLYKLHALVMGGAPTPGDPAAEDAGAEGGTVAADATIADAAREITGLKSAADVVRSLYSLDVKAGLARSAVNEKSKAALALRKSVLDKAQADMLLTPAKRSIIEKRLNAGSYTDEQLIEDLGVAVPVVDTRLIEAPGAQIEETRANAPKTADDLLKEPAFIAYAKSRNLSDKEARLTAVSYVRVNKSAPFEAPTLRFN